jgi:hypothetical protein
MNGFLYTLLLIFVIAPVNAWSASSYYLLPGAGIVNLNALPGNDKSANLQALSIRAGYAANRYVSAETDLVSARSEQDQFSSIALFAAHRHAMTDALFVKARLGWTFNRLKSNDNLPAATGNGFSGGLALGWKFSQLDIELDYTAMERDINAIMLHVALFK